MLSQVVGYAYGPLNITYGFAGVQFGEEVER